MVKRLLAAAGAFAALCLVAPASAQTVANLPVTCNSAGTICTQATPVANSDGTRVMSGSSTIVTGQVSVGTSATLIAAARPGRQKIGVTVVGAVQCTFGNTGVTASTGWPLAAVAYASDSWDTTAAIYAVCASTTTVAFREQF